MSDFPHKDAAKYRAKGNRRNVIWQERFSSLHSLEIKAPEEIKGSILPTSTLCVRLFTTLEEDIYLVSHRKL